MSSSSNQPRASTPYLNREPPIDPIVLFRHRAASLSSVLAAMVDHSMMPCTAGARRARQTYPPPAGAFRALRQRGHWTPSAPPPPVYVLPSSSPSVLAVARLTTHPPASTTSARG